jgi:hypothetical protein
MQLGSEDRSLVKSMRRSDLENIAAQVLQLNYFRLMSLDGKEVCILKSTADKILIRKVYANIQNTKGYCSIEDLMMELEERGYFTANVSIEEITIAEL